MRERFDSDEVVPILSQHPISYFNLSIFAARGITNTAVLMDAHVDVDD